MLSMKRMEMITQYLEQMGSVDVNTLADALGVTGKTIRQDLIKMENMGILERVRGGATLKKVDAIFPIPQRKQKHIEEKERIAQIASDLIEDGDIIILDAGSTTLQLAKKIENQKIIVVTNDPYIVNELLYKENVTLYCTGGKLNRHDSSCIFLGADTKKSLEQYKATKCFIGTSAVDFDQGLMVFSTDEVEVKAQMIQSAQKVICLADYSKFHKMAFTSFSSLKQLDTIITDESIIAEDIERIEKMGIELLK